MFIGGVLPLDPKLSSSHCFKRSIAYTQSCDHEAVHPVEVMKIIAGLQRREGTSRYHLHPFGPLSRVRSGTIVTARMPETLLIPHFAQASLLERA